MGKRYPFKLYEEVKESVQSLGIKTQKEYQAWAKSPNRPHDIPANPDYYYWRQWISWRDFLGTENEFGKGHKFFMSFTEAREFSRLLGFIRRKEWEEYMQSPKRPLNMPKAPQGSYRKEWISWKDFLGITK